MRFTITLFLLAIGDIPFAGVDLPFVLASHQTERKHLIETMPGGVAVADFDGDGRLDLYFVNGAQVPSLRKGAGDANTLLRNEGGLRFSDTTVKAGVAGEGYSIGAAAADYDNDGDADLFVAGVFRNSLLRNRGNGTFETVNFPGNVWSVGGAWFDYDRDGLLDLFVVNYAKWTPEFDTFCGDQKRGIRVYCHPRLFEGLPNALYRNKGDGTFEDVSMKTGIAKHVGRGMAAAVADYDGDGWMDVFVTNDKMANFLFRNLAGKGFEETALMAGVALPADGKAISGMGADFGDFDRDGRPDLVFTALNNETFPLFRNVGGGEFADVTHSSGLAKLSARYSGWSVAMADFDNDGWKDVVTANGHVNDRIEAFEPSVYKQPNTLFVNRKGRFSEVREFGAARAWRGGAAADLDGDGRLDFVSSALNERASAWRNTQESGNWLGVRLRGTKSNRDGIGAVVRVAGQTNQMTTAVGYASSVRGPVHFGLGALTEADIEVRWPTGVVQKVAGVKAGQVVEVGEP